LRGGLEEARRRSVELGERARSAAQRDAAPSTRAEANPAAPAAAPAAPRAAEVDADIPLPLDDAGPPTQPAYASPPAWTAPPTMAPLPEAPPPPALTACPQCLSAVTDADVFCGVCGFRLK
jgi:hypothetical protein